MIEYILDFLMNIGEWFNDHIRPEKNNIRLVVMVCVTTPLLLIAVPLAYLQDVRRFVAKVLDKISLWCLHRLERWSSWLLTWLDPWQGCAVHTATYVALMSPPLALCVPQIFWAVFRGHARVQIDDPVERGLDLAARIETRRARTPDPTHNWKQEGF